MPDLDEEVLLGNPEMLETGPLRGYRLIEIVPENLALAHLGPGSGDLDLGHQAELHGTDLLK
jgi:hypothetical protein